MFHCRLVSSGLFFLTALWQVSPLRGVEAPQSQAYSILKRSCVECHGAERQEGGLRLDSHQWVVRGGISGSVVDRNTPSESELIRRISLSKDDPEVMPRRGALLSPRERSVLEEWIQAGAQWPTNPNDLQHWSYIAPVQPALPDATSASSAKTHPVDAFVADKLKLQKLVANPVAEPRVLIRRLYLDVVGIPPTVKQVETFVLAAKNAGLQVAVQAAVEELLQSPLYGQKWAIPWLDAARYADSHGFQRDDLHELWAYRDWVIDALNSDMPFDQFTIEQIAGDLLPDATQSQRVATGFNRCAPCNVEAGTDPEENRFNQVVDRVNTLGYVWLGTSLECAQCHDHKYDPFTQKDYYGLFAFFNQTELEADRTNPNSPGSIKFQGPYLELADSTKNLRREQIDAQIKALKKEIADFMPDPNVASSSGQLRTIRPNQFESTEGASYEILSDNSVLLLADAPDRDNYVVELSIDPLETTGLWIEALTHESLPGKGPGRGDSQRPNFVLNELQVFSIDSAGNANVQPLELDHAVADFEQKNYPAKNAIDGQEASGWAIAPRFGQDHWIAVRFADRTAIEKAKSLRLVLVQRFGNARTLGRIRVSAVTGPFEAALPRASGPSAQESALQSEIAKLEQQRSELEPVKTLVMQQVAHARTSTMFARGDYRSPLTPIEPNTPAILHPLMSTGKLDRLDLAKWLIDPQNPLVARVVVNRIWAELFGRGLVTTPEDFGIKGDPPSHPELLDWLACDWMENGWSQKQLLRRILTSEAYLRSSRSSAMFQQVDPENQWLARGPRFRLSAELVRDNALAISGLLSLKQSGPPIRPPQPANLWKKVGGQAYDYQVSSGEDKYRRGVYVVLKRMSPHPSLINFDATSRMACRVKRTRSNTPLQALTLLNDPVYVEAAAALAARIQAELPSGTIAEQIRFGFQLAVARLPSQQEIKLLEEFYINEFATELNPEISEQKRSELAWFAVASLLLNLDETITKE